eukprot:TRINITY_DN113468_c0_g1_i1.p1 TRINITY_DN113468_c0_g1~~TRINITY_DN113468_c0_g1_i1.p1  ORF type:complete len:565 (+),score=123.16 TRINITY_DN113468_c0_g1_i1:75-1769(+)
MPQGKMLAMRACRQSLRPLWSQHVPAAAAIGRRAVAGRAEERHDRASSWKMWALVGAGGVVTSGAALGGSCSRCEAPQDDLSAQAIRGWPLFPLPSKRGFVACEQSSSAARVPVFVMMPLDTVTNDAKHVRSKNMAEDLDLLAAAGVKGVMVDVWWGLCETKPGEYEFGGYLELMKMLKARGLKCQCVFSFHKCGGNVGDTVDIPLPLWALSAAKADSRGLYRSRNGSPRNEDCLSLSMDEVSVLPSKAGALRTPLTCYEEFARNFSETVAKAGLWDVVGEIQVGTGPCGELRYPSYVERDGWRYPGLGLMMSADDGMSARLREDWRHAGLGSVAVLEAALSGEAVADTNDTPGAGPHDAAAAAAHAWYLKWYTRQLLEHGDQVMSRVVKGVCARPLPDFSVKVAGIHWWHTHESRAAETFAGYTNKPDFDAYYEVAKMLAAFEARELRSRGAAAAKSQALLNFTCLEMNNGHNDCLSAPEDLIAQVRRACVSTGVPMCGENALGFDPSTGDWPLGQIQKQIRAWSSGRDRMHAFTFLRLDDSLRKDLKAGPKASKFAKFVQSL